MNPTLGSVVPLAMFSYYSSPAKVVTTLKQTAKPVTDLSFPAVTICASGLHMDNVEKKVAENFAKWREENNKKDNNEEAIEKDIKEYMHTAFQIKREAIKSESVNILDILDTMIAPNVEASVAVNSVRENIFACKESSEQTNDAAGRRKRQDACTCSCSGQGFHLSGANCFWALSEEKLLITQ